ncbi:hypothetical protein [Marinomonas sp. IMCC 4694]|uniref:hypothetical protein n=1 Tax=Marinomonas sp. IMCC 4694 TaxID=2605432 RepID=UPI0011E64D9C|nr:hypothetical protein [Marinomonas sp. IMCC 4694]TYL49272.1 hypothetical protein FXV75_15940 [Marinomonas sp. IMCC 4694]
MRVFTFCVLLFLGFFSVVTHATETPQGPVILTVSDTIHTKPSKQGVTFDMAMLNRLPQRFVTTRTPWTKEVHTYQGFSAVDLFAYIKSEGTRLKVTALNQYMTDIPLTDFVEHGAIFATHMDGNLISIRNLGPIMMIYPFDDKETLKSEEYYGRSIWQISRIESMVLME